LKISEIKEKRIIRRATRNFDLFGNRIYDEFEYEFPYNPYYKGNERERLFAKVIDMIPFFLIFFFVFHKMYLISILLSILCVILFGTFTESYWGTTLGKKIYRIKVINEEGNYPGFLHSMARNFLCLVNFSPIFTDYVPPPNSVMGVETTNMNFSMHMNNTICKTYIVKESKIKEIKHLLGETKE